MDVKPDVFGVLINLNLDFWVLVFDQLLLVRVFGVQNFVMLLHAILVLFGKQPFLVQRIAVLDGPRLIRKEPFYLNIELINLSDIVCLISDLSSSLLILRGMERGIVVYQPNLATSLKTKTFDMRVNSFVPVVDLYLQKCDKTPLT